MNAGRYYATVMPIAGILYVIALLTIHTGPVAVVGAMIFAILAIIGTLFRGR